MAVTMVATTLSAPRESAPVGLALSGSHPDDPLHGDAGVTQRHPRVVRRNHGSRGGASMRYIAAQRAYLQRWRRVSHVDAPSRSHLQKDTGPLMAAALPRLRAPRLPRRRGESRGSRQESPRRRTVGPLRAPRPARPLGRLLLGDRETARPRGLAGGGERDLQEAERLQLAGPLETTGVDRAQAAGRDDVGQQ